MLVRLSLLCLGVGVIGCTKPAPPSPYKSNVKVAINGEAMPIKTVLATSYGGVSSSPAAQTGTEGVDGEEAASESGESDEAVPRPGSGQAASPGALVRFRAVSHPIPSLSGRAV